MRSKKAGLKYKMKLKNLLISVVLTLVFVAGLAAKNYWQQKNNNDRHWNVFETETNGSKEFLPLIGFVKPDDEGKLPSGRKVKGFARNTIPYIMIFYSIGTDGWQAAFWDSQYSWLYDSKSGKTFKMAENLSDTAWYDVANQHLLTPTEAIAQDIIYTRL